MTHAWSRNVEGSIRGIIPTHPVNIPCGRKPEKTHDSRWALTDSFHISVRHESVARIEPKISSQGERRLLERLHHRSPWGTPNDGHPCPDVHFITYLFTRQFLQATLLWWASLVPRLQLRRAGSDASSGFPFLTKRRSKSKRLGTRLDGHPHFGKRHPNFHLTYFFKRSI
jgi:hypothetical protein